MMFLCLEGQAAAVRKQIMKAKSVGDKMEKIHRFLFKLVNKDTNCSCGNHAILAITLNCLSVAQNGLFSSTASSVVNLLNT